MIYGIGTDICSIARIEKQKDRFFERYFTETERAYCKGRPASLAGIFAAKEAFVKALGTGFISFDLKAIEIDHDTSGAPFYRLTNWAEQQLQEKNINNSFLSISHDNGNAVAFCILER